MNGTTQAPDTTWVDCNETETALVFAAGVEFVIEGMSEGWLTPEAVVWRLRECIVRYDGEAGIRRPQEPLFRNRKEWEDWFELSYGHSPHDLALPTTEEGREEVASGLNA